MRKKVLQNFQKLSLALFIVNYFPVSNCAADDKIMIRYNGWCIFGPTPIRPTAHPTY